MWAVTWIGDLNLEYWSIIYVYVLLAVGVGGFHIFRFCLCDAFSCSTLLLRRTDISNALADQE